MLATAMPPQASHHLPLSSSSSGAEASASHPIMPPAIPPQPSSVSHPSMSCGLTSNGTTSRPSAPPRPKLTLQTSALPVAFGSSSTGLSLSLAAGPTASPTVRNTFKNAYDFVYPSSATASPSRTSISRLSKPSSPFTSSNPYQLPLGVRSILRNSPLESKRRSNSVAPSAQKGASTSRRVFFPTKKQVTYRNPLEEEIETVTYTARHSDLVSESEADSCETSSDEESDYSTSSTVSSETTPSDDGDGETEPTASGPTSEKKKKRKYRNSERQVRAVALMDGLEDPYVSLTPQTPRQGRLKRRRAWRWTLGPLEGTHLSDATERRPSVPTHNAPKSPILGTEKEPTKEPNLPEVAAPDPKTRAKLSASISITSSDISKSNATLSQEPSDPDPPH
ncbi:uncharacterized protein BJX67DRAFT_133038 [Aspergillus lucknowensis]|uniref:Uncharacterized protein n=1 Tax=Aspergillus lucknowensis TaxID=176173 RepID=A0ABR4LPZ4_9EURO